MAFLSRSPKFPHDAARHCRLILMKALPARADHGFANFGAAIKELQVSLGGGARFLVRKLKARS
jgi:predicted sugar kinase